MPPARSRSGGVRTPPVPAPEPRRLKRPCELPTIAELLAYPVRVAQLSPAAARALAPPLAALREAVLLRALEAVDETASQLRDNAVPVGQPATLQDNEVRAYTTAEFAQRLGKPAAYVRELCRSGRLAGATR